MAEVFPTTPRARTRIRLAAAAIGVAAVVLAVRTTFTSTGWVGRVFPGFMVLDNGVIASVGLPDWSGSGVSDLYQSKILAVDGRPVLSTDDLYAYVESLPAGTPVRYLLRRNGLDEEVKVPSQRFTVRDWFLLFGPFLLNGLAYVAAALVVLVLRPGALGWAFVSFAVSWAFFLLTAMDLYWPATFFRLHVAAETLVPPSVVQLALLFPTPHRWARWRWLAYLPSLAILILYELYLYQPPVYSMLLELNMALLGLAPLVLLARLIG
jgi:hypothetical protein